MVPVCAVRSFGPPPNLALEACALEDGALHASLERTYAEQLLKGEQSGLGCPSTSLRPSGTHSLALPTFLLLRSKGRRACCAAALAGRLAAAQGERAPEWVGQQTATAAPPGRAMWRPSAPHAQCVIALWATVLRRRGRRASPQAGRAQQEPLTKAAGEQQLSGAARSSRRPPASVIPPATVAALDGAAATGGVSTPRGAEQQLVLPCSPISPEDETDARQAPPRPTPSASPASPAPLQAPVALPEAAQAKLWYAKRLSSLSSAADQGSDASLPGALPAHARERGESTRPHACEGEPARPPPPPLRVWVGARGGTGRAHPPRGSRVAASPCPLSRAPLPCRAAHRRGHAPRQAAPAARRRAAAAPLSSRLAAPPSPSARSRQRSAAPAAAAFWRQ